MASLPSRPTESRRRVSLGAAFGLREMLDRAVVSAEDVLDANRAWNDACRVSGNLGLVGLLNAESVDFRKASKRSIEQRAFKDFLWDAANHLFRHGKTMQAVSAKAIRSVVSQLAKTATDAVRTVTGLMQKGLITVKTWQERLAKKVKAVHLAAGAAGSGGFKGMLPKVAHTIADTVKKWFGKISGFGKRLERAEASGVEAHHIVPDLLKRAPLAATSYTGAGLETHEKAKREGAKASGYDEERSILQFEADHCEQCVTEAKKGWKKLGEILPVGRRSCRQNCRCVMEYRRSEDGRVI